MALNPLDSTMRTRNRYIVFKAESEKTLDKKDVGGAITDTTLRFVGELGVSRMSPYLVEWNYEKQAGILKVTHNTLDEAKAVLALVKEANNKPVVLHSVKVSGILKKAKALV